MSAAELERVKRRVRSSFVFGLETTLRRAVELGEFELFWGDARGIASELDHYLAVSAEDVQKAAAKYLGNPRRVVIEVTPAPKPAAAPSTPAAPPKSPPAAAPKAPAGPPAATPKAQRGAP